MAHSLALHDYHDAVNGFHSHFARRAAIETQTGIGSDASKAALRVHGRANIAKHNGAMSVGGCFHNHICHYIGDELEDVLMHEQVPSCDSLESVYEWCDWHHLRWADINDDVSEFSHDGWVCCCFLFPDALDEILVPEWAIAGCTGVLREFEAGYTGSSLAQVQAVPDESSSGCDVFDQLAQCEKRQTGLNKNMDALFLRLKSLLNTPDQNHLLNELRNFQDNVVSQSACVDSVGLVFRRIMDEHLAPSTPALRASAARSLSSPSLRSVGPSDGHCKVGSLQRDPGFGKGPRRTRRKR